MKKGKINEHFNELRRRLYVVVAFFFACFGVSYFFSSELYAFLVEPLANIFASEGLSRRLIFTDLTEAFVTHIKVAIYAALFVTTPLLMLQMYQFIAPGLFKRERRVALQYMLFSPVLFLLGAMLVYFYIMPLAWAFFLSFETNLASNLPLVLEAKVSDYLNLSLSLIFAFGITFQLPLILTLLARVNLLSVDSLRKYRRHAIVLNFIVAAILTPPDVLSQIALAVPLILLYEISILLCAKIQKV